MYEKLQEEHHLCLKQLKSNVFETKLGFVVCPAVFLAFVQSSLPVCTFLLIGMGRGIQCHFMLERYNFLFDFATLLSDVAVKILS